MLKKYFLGSIHESSEPSKQEKQNRAVWFTLRATCFWRTSDKGITWPPARIPRAERLIAAGTDEWRVKLSHIKTEPAGREHVTLYLPANRRELITTAHGNPYTRYHHDQARRSINGRYHRIMASALGYIQTDWWYQRPTGPAILF